MKSGLARIGATLGLLLVLVGCTDTVVFLVGRSSQDWHFVQSVGGMALGTPARDDRGHVWLPIRCDVTGIHTITVKPTIGESGLVCVPPTVRIRGQTIYLTIRTSLPTAPYDSRCPPADLGSLAAGEYSVVYRSPGGSEHPLGSIQIWQ